MDCFIVFDWVMWRLVNRPTAIVRRQCSMERRARLIIIIITRPEWRGAGFGNVITIDPVPLITHPDPPDSSFASMQVRAR